MTLCVPAWGAMHSKDRIWRLKILSPLVKMIEWCKHRGRNPMRVQFWGTRGSIATPGQGTVRYGGNTSCVSVLTRDGTHLVLDAGTGMRGLGIALMAQDGAARR
ncbi:MAG: hypothetical protein ABIN37_00855, partial [Burkholderiaceae bacterium]